MKCEYEHAVQKIIQLGNVIKERKTALWVNGKLDKQVKGRLLTLKKLLANNEKDFSNVNDETLVKAWKALFGEEWKKSFRDNDRIREMKSIINGGTMPCVSLNNWVDCIDVLRNNK